MMTHSHPPESGRAGRGARMALDGSDFELLKSIRKTMRETGETTGQKIERVLEAERDLLSVAKKSLGNDERLIEAFNRMAGALEELTGEVRALRADLTPPIDKPKKLPLPGGRR
jgi:hypothetical protein